MPRDSILREISHRAFPYPDAPWIMAQRWEKLLFAHWQVDPDSISRLLPAGLELDLFEHGSKQQCWIGIVPFLMNQVALRGIGNLPVASTFLELNVRTYVIHGGRRGVYFFSLDAESILAVEGARLWFRLPYLLASMKQTESERGSGWVEYESSRLDTRAGAARLQCRYRPLGEPFYAEAGTLEYFLTERYCLFVPDGEQIIIGNIHHLPWPLYEAEAEFIENSMTESLGLTLEGTPHLLYSAGIDTIEWAPTRQSI